MQGLAVTAAIMVASPSLGGSQSLTDDIRLSEFEGGQAVLRVLRMQPAPWANHEITFYVSAPLPGEDPLDGALSALITRTDGPYQVARSATCRALRDALDGFRRLPDFAFSPPSLNRRSPSPSPLPIEPTKKDGASYRITHEVSVPNGNRMTVSVSDYSGDYAVWADQALPALNGCWTSPY